MTVLSKKWCYFFSLLDQNHNGVLEFNDFQKMLDKIDRIGWGVVDNKEKILCERLMRKSFDRLRMQCKTSNDYITLREWLRTVNVETLNNNHYFLRWLITGVVRMLFRMFDENGDGYIDFKEFQRMYAVLNMDPKDITFAFKRMDKNSDGWLSKWEMQEAIKEFFTRDDVLDENYVFGHFNLIDRTYLMKSINEV